MKYLITTIAATLFVASAGASHVYHGLGEGNPSLYPYGPNDEQVPELQPRTTERVNFYGGFASMNSDISPSRDRSGSRIPNPDLELPQIYQNFGASPDVIW
jgi:hypothetical protein